MFKKNYITLMIDCSSFRWGMGLKERAPPVRCIYQAYFIYDFILLDFFKQQERRSSASSSSSDRRSSHSSTGSVSPTGTMVKKKPAVPPPAPKPKPVSTESAAPLPPPAVVKKPPPPAPPARQDSIKEKGKFSLSKHNTVSTRYLSSGQNRQKTV